MSTAPSLGRKPPRPRDQPLSPAAQGQPRPLVGLGTRGAGRGQAQPTSRSCSRSATPPATGATSWRTRASRTPPPPRVMNELFVNIKVDREERPDIDAIYMRALHSLGEQGGWPLTMFLDSEARPFWGGTYFPPDAALRPARLSRTCCARSSRIYREEPDKVRHNAGLLVDALGEREQSNGHGPTSTTPLLADLTGRMVNAVDMRARRPCRRAEVPAVELLLAAVARRHPLRPRGRQARRRHHAHQHLPGRHLRSPRRRLRALLGRRALARAALREDALRQRAAHRPDVRGLPRDRQRALRAPHRRDGRLAAARDDRRGRRLRRLARCRQRRRGRQVLRLDARREIVEVLGEADAKLFCDAYDVTDAGNWEGHTILNRLRNLDSALARRGEGARRTCAPSCWRAAPAASAPAGTTRCWPTGTA